MHYLNQLLLPSMDRQRYIQNWGDRKINASLNETWDLSCFCITYYIYTITRWKTNLKEGSMYKLQPRLWQAFLFIFEHFISGIKFKMGVHGMQSYTKIFKILSSRNIITLESYLKLYPSLCELVLFLHYKEWTKSLAKSIGYQ